MGEEDEIAIGSKFFKIMMPGFEEKLKLPPAFCEKVKNEKSDSAVLESCKGRWKMNVCRSRREVSDSDDDRQIMVLEDGWPGFADEHELSLGDFLVFEHTAKLHFNVTVFDVSACQKQYPQLQHHHQTINPISHSKKKRPCFSYELTHFAATHKQGKVTVPIEFARENDLTEKRGVVLKDGGTRRGRKWRVKLWVQNWPRILVKMTTGWHHFVAANNLEAGDLCTFQLNPIESSTSKYASFDVRISRNTKR